MFVGRSGSGKTELLNSLVNYHEGINMSDTFRYVIVDETHKKSSASSNTDHIIDFHLKANGDKPGLILIDTSGFVDT